MIKKINEETLKTGLTVKTYTDEEIKTIMDLLKKVQDTVDIKYIQVEEGVEQEQQTYSGQSFSPNGFKNAYPRISKYGRELSYSIVALFNEAKIRLGMEEGKEIISLMTNVANIELDDLVASKVNTDTLTF